MSRSAVAHAELCRAPDPFLSGAALEQHLTLPQKTVWRWQLTNAVCDQLPCLAASSSSLRFNACVQPRCGSMPMLSTALVSGAPIQGHGFEHIQPLDLDQLYADSCRDNESLLSAWSWQAPSWMGLPAPAKRLEQGCQRDLSLRADLDQRHLLCEVRALGVQVAQMAVHPGAIA